MKMSDEKEKQIRQMQFQALPEAKPFFATNVIVSPNFNEYMRTKKRESTITMTFTNQNLIVSIINMTVEHTKALIEILKEKVAEAERFVKTGEKPKQSVTEKTTEEPTYIG